MCDEKSCPKCGAILPANAPAGICPQCLMAAGLESGIGSRLDGAASGGETQTVGGPSNREFTPPTVAELAGRFPLFEIVELLGYGGMGAVYKARQTKLDRLVALKIIRPETANNEAFELRFNREAKALARLSHQNIVTIHDFGEVEASAVGEARTQPLYYFVMEYVDGANLRQLMQAGELSPEQALAIVPQICDALQYAHDEGVVHRDIKPENILLDRRGRVKIADYGLAKLVSGTAEEPNLTGTHQVMGTMRYMAPEQMEASTRVDHRADIYSLGVVFYEMLTGEVPVGHFDPPSKKYQLDVRLDDVVLRSLAREPDRRYQHASEIKTDVEAVSSTSAEPIQPAISSQASTAIDTHWIDERVRAAELAEIAPDWIAIPICGLFILGWSAISLLWNFGILGVLLALAIMASASYRAVEMQLRYLPKVKQELGRESRWLRRLQQVFSLFWFLGGIGSTIAFQLVFVNVLFWMFTSTVHEELYTITESEKATNEALQLAQRVGLDEVKLGFAGWSNSLPNCAKLMITGIFALSLLLTAALVYLKTRRYGHSWKYALKPSLSITFLCVSMLIFVHFVHVMIVGFSFSPMPVRKIQLNCGWDQVSQVLSEWIDANGYRQVEYADFKLLKDEENIGGLHKRSYAPVSWFESSKASWKYVVQRPKPPLVISIATRNENLETCLEIVFPKLPIDSPEKAMWTKLADDLEKKLLAAADTDAN